MIPDPAPVAATGAEVLRGLCGGAVHLPGDAAFDEVRLPWNLQVDAIPAAVAYPAFPSEVADVVRAAASVGLKVAPQGTGHGAPPLAGHLADGVLLRTSAMTELRIDAERRTARVGAGVRWGDVVDRAGRVQLAARHTSSPGVGVAGSSLGGGLSWYARHAGLQCSALTAVELVLADGTFVRATDSQDSDLLWAARGGGGGFGVVTALEFDLLPVPRVYAGMLAWDWRHARRVLSAWGAWAGDAPETVTSIARLLQAPDEAWLPADVRGRRLVVIDAVALGDPARCRAGARDRCGRCAPSWTPSRTSRPPDAARLHLDPEAPTAVYANSVLLADLPDRAVEALVAAAGPDSGSELLFVELRQPRGSTVPAGATRRCAEPDGRLLPRPRCGRRHRCRVASGARGRPPGAERVAAVGNRVGVPADGRRGRGRPAGLADRVLAAARGHPRGGRSARAVRATASRDGSALTAEAQVGPKRSSRGRDQRGCPQHTTTPEETMTLVETRTEPITNHAPFAELDARTVGTVAAPGDEAYDALVSPWNVAVPVRPAAVLAARTAQDVVEAVRFATRHGLRVTPQATGHGPMADLIGELLVTTKELDECVVHPEGWARVGAGVKWLRVVEAAAPHGLAPLSGSITDVGIVGYTTGGGLGPMARTYGLAIDKVRAIEVVTGDGVLRRATPTEHPDLFFGLRGGKGMLGIITAIEFDLVHQPTFYGGSLWFDGEDAATVIERWLHWSEDLPELATTSIALFQMPSMEGVPPELADRLTLSVRYVWTGDAQEGERRFAAIREAAPVLVDDVALKPYTAIDSVHTDPLDPTPAHEAAAVLTGFPADAVDALLALTGAGSGSPQVLVEVRQMGGATARAGEHESAFSARDTAYSLLTVGIAGTPGVEAHAEKVLEAMDPWTGGHRLPNFTFTPEEYVDAYDERTLARLRRAIRTYDPHGVMAIGRVLAA